MKSFWNERYQQEIYSYGIHPNAFLASQLNETSETGYILLPCEGEGRNAVFAAKKGWKVDAFDYSESGFNKAQKLAKEYGVSIHYSVCDALEYDYGVDKYDVIAFIYAHFDESARIYVHRKAVEALKKGGKIILEAFQPEQLNNNSGGPKDLRLLYTKEQLKEDFHSLNILQCEYTTINLDEGPYHQGKAEVVRLIGIK